MKYRVREEGDVAIVVFEGDIDLEFSGDVREILLENISKARRVLVDMSGVTLIDSSGVASLIEAFQSAKGSGSRFALVAVSDAAMRVLRLAHLERVFPIFDSVADAVADAG